MFGHVGSKIRCLLDIQVEMLSRQVDTESGVQGAFGETERTSPQEAATDGSK